MAGRLSDTTGIEDDASEPAPECDDADNDDNNDGPNDNNPAAQPTGTRLVAPALPQQEQSPIGAVVQPSTTSRRSDDMSGEGDGGGGCPSEESQIATAAQQVAELATVPSSPRRSGMVAATAPTDCMADDTLSLKKDTPRHPRHDTNSRTREQHDSRANEGSGGEDNDNTGDLHINQGAKREDTAVRGIRKAGDSGVASSSSILITKPRFPPSLLRHRPTGSWALPGHQPLMSDPSTANDINPLPTGGAIATNASGGATGSALGSVASSTTRTYSFGRLKPALRPPGSLTQVGPNVPQPMPTDASSGGGRARATARMSSSGQDSSTNPSNNSTMRSAASPPVARGPPATTGGSSLSRYTPTAPSLLPPPRPQAHSQAAGSGGAGSAGGMGAGGGGGTGSRDLDGCVVWYTDDSAAEADIESMASVASVDSREVWCSSKRFTGVELMVCPNSPVPEYQSRNLLPRPCFASLCFVFVGRATDASFCRCPGGGTELDAVKKAG